MARFAEKTGVTSKGAKAASPQASPRSGPYLKSTAAPNATNERSRFEGLRPAPFAPGRAFRATPSSSVRLIPKPFRIVGAICAVETQCAHLKLGQTWVAAPSEWRRSS